MQRMGRLIVLLSAGFLIACQTTPKAPESESLTREEVLERRQQILEMSESAITRLYGENPAARLEIESAVGYGVFDISTVNAVLLVGARGKGVIFENMSGKQTFMRAARAGTGPGVGYQRLYQVFVFKSEAALNQFKMGDSAGADVSASATVGTAAKQLSFNPYITVYQMSEKGFALQANWGGTAYLVDQELNR